MADVWLACVCWGRSSLSCTGPCACRSKIGMATHEGICRWLDIQASPFVKAIMTCISGSKGGIMGFEGYLRMVVNTSLYTKNELLRRMCRRQVNAAVAGPVAASM